MAEVDLPPERSRPKLVQRHDFFVDEWTYLKSQGGFGAGGFVLPSGDTGKLTSRTGEGVGNETDGGRGID